MAEKIYWKGLEEKFNAEGVKARSQKEFQEDIPIISEFGDENLTEAPANRRDFLKVLGFSVSAAAIAASCEMPVRKSIPFLDQPEGFVPGVANYYNSTFTDGGVYVPIRVKQRDGRPIKIDGNDLSKITNGGTNAMAQAAVLSLYDKFGRHTRPLVDGEVLRAEPTEEQKKKGEKGDELEGAAAYAALDAEVIPALRSAGAVTIVSTSVLSPSTKKAIEAFTTKYASAKHVTYDPVSYSGLLDATKESYGVRQLPQYNFDKAEMIVGIGADFLGSWISPVEYSAKYAATRKIKDKKNPKISRHVQVESTLSLSGSNADTRILVKPSQEDLAVAKLYALVTGGSAAGLAALPENGDEVLAKVAKELKAAGKKGLVVSGSNNKDTQVLVYAINEALGSVGTTVDLSRPANLKQGDDKAMNQFVDGLASGSVKGAIFLNANPVYDHPRGEEIKKGLESAAFSLTLSEKNDETSDACTYIAPTNHFLESWDDAEPYAGSYSITQPTIDPLFDTRDAAESLLKWAEAIDAEETYYDFIRKTWKEEVFSKVSGLASFDVFWDRLVHDGVYELPASAVTSEATAYAGNAGSALSKVSASGKDGGLEVIFYQKVGIQDGKYADNPLLQELPDPISKVTWDNYAAVSMEFARENGFNTTLDKVEQGYGTDVNLCTVKVNGKELTLPVVIQPGVADGVIAIAVGYGHTKGGRAGLDNSPTSPSVPAPGLGVGTNAYPALTIADGNLSYVATGASIENLNKDYPFAQTQMFHQIDPENGFINGLKGGRDVRRIVKETTIDRYKENAFAGNEDRAHVKGHLQTLYGYHDYNGHKWELAIDLNSCFGCGACVVACNVENNVPVVGKDEVRRSREMHWLRIDRYYAGEEGDDKLVNPSVIFQPMMCQHCDNAPCENVCPVSATNHSSEGLNQMAYNRCIGTRYCANNCPYKVRRFNWFDYLNADSFKKGTFFDNDEHDRFHMAEDLTRMVLNPDVTVRSRGVMEKCSFCVQRIQESKLTAKKEGRVLGDEVKTACQTACASGAIVFGDINNHETEAYKMFADERAFKVIEEIHTLPSVSYLTKIRNAEFAKTAFNDFGKEHGHHEAEHAEEGAHGESGHDDHGGGGH